MSVVVIGGGVGGLSVAHELAERGVPVTVYEAAPRFGGKARSFPVPGTGRDGRPDLPGEHGLRHFPAFYQHLHHLLRRIPCAEGTVADRLRPTQSVHFCLTEGRGPHYPCRFPRTLGELRDGLGAVLANLSAVPRDELGFFVERMLIYATSCDARRFGEFEQTAWWDFVGAEARSETYRWQIAQGLTRSLAAMQAQVSSTRTIGMVMLQLMFDMLLPGRLDATFVLDGPSSDRWIDPWVEHLRARGVELHAGVGAEAIHVERGRVAGVTLADGSSVEGEQYVLAVPVNSAAELVDADLARACPSLSRLDRLYTAWMNGLQIFLRRDVPITPGHTIYVDSPWALSSISQRQFWRRDVRDYGDGRAAGVLSLVISDWNAPGRLTGKPARECTREELLDEVWSDLERHLDSEGIRIDRADQVEWFLDPSIEMGDGPTRNTQPMLVNTVDTWRHRPEATTELPDLFVAADFVKTHADLACMEAAHEAGRRAVNGVLDARGHPGARCFVRPLWEPAWLKPLKAADALRHKLGRPNLLDR